ncbi:hypothetical protein CF15_05725 [Pyrodictium occultum]|uniref:TIGR00304 family protein n=1 Tax=Pyrodictium occultum TaxID=2309 RepID=A0A0V8RWB5_PYROC|nr:DUF131 domain-containing protein [Pyrodictium occultum]KSW12250.1 hypothetical protein CF15_05725 [Pyrodictium occultum]
MSTPVEGGGTLSKLVPAGIALIFIGVLLIFIGVFYSIIRSGGKGEYGGVVVIGPFPIVFGSGGGAVKIAVIGAIILMILALVIMLLPLLLARGGTVAWKP